MTKDKKQLFPLGLMGVIILVLLLVIDMTWRKWSLQSNFFSLRLIEILQLFLTSVLGISAVIFGYYLNKKLSNSGKIKEELLKMLDELKTQVTIIYELGKKYAEKPDDYLSREIAIAANDAEMKITFLRDLEGEPGIYNIGVDDSVEIDYLRLKVSITDKGFREKNSEYSVEQKLDISKNYNKLKNRLDKCKINLFVGN